MIHHPLLLSIVEYSNNWYQSKVPSDNLTTRRYILRSHMDQQEGLSSNRYPLFDGTNYAFWSIRMRSYLMALGLDT